MKKECEICCAFFLFLVGRGHRFANMQRPQDSAGWTPLMIASSLRDGDDLVDVLLSKEADVNAKSKGFLFQLRQ